MSADPRITAWLGAWQRFEMLQKIKVELKPDMDTPMSEGFWGLMAEAQLLATLASADTLVGIASGEVIQEQERRDAEAEAHAERAMESLRKRRERQDLSCTCEFDDSQCPIHAQGDDIAEDDDGQD